MKTLKTLVVVALTLMVATSFASRKVKSKIGDLEVTYERGGGTVVCTLGFNDELTLVREAGSDALVKGDCQGWVPKSKIEFVAAGPGDNSFTLGEYDVHGWIDNANGIFVLENDVEDFDGVTIDRDFKEYLTYTIDREQTEMRHGEN
ncbi:MAG: hypothetical protein MJY99_09400 [Fibrobacter sp.]|uniref:hypothetical protein n=1 Tax=Fibrobacter sp. TaxID=35828 RepID=UPI00388F1A3A|nr:hypothetical protein [Fibrobacter sp.]